MTAMEFLMSVLRGLGIGLALSALFWIVGYAAWVVGGKIGALEAEVKNLQGEVSRLQKKERENRSSVRADVRAENRVA